ncbi:MAG: hypothetical protein GF399_00655 [Candidatus Coatesbacteria bacterium]|nr:hypothetical protein [Candidatus Coatesbacteria bacterium]
MCKQNIAVIILSAVVFTLGCSDDSDNTNANEIVEGSVDKVTFSTPEALIEAFISAVNSNDFSVFDDMIPNQNMRFNITQRINNYNWKLTKYEILESNKGNMIVSFVNDTKLYVDDGYFFQNIYLSQVNGNNSGDPRLDN